MNYYLTNELKKNLKKIKHKRHRLSKKVVKQLRLFEHNHRHPSLRTHKLKNNLQQYWSISIHRSVRMIYYLSTDSGQTKAIFFMIGTHDQVYRAS